MTELSHHASLSSADYSRAPRESPSVFTRVEVPQPFRADGEVGCVELAPMKVAQVEVRGGVDLEVRAIDWFYGTWLPSSRFVPDDQTSFEAFRGLPFSHGDDYFELDAEFPLVDRTQPL